MLLIDTEGLDCDLVAAQDWCRLGSPLFIVFEWKHCTPKSYSTALHHLHSMSCREPLHDGTAKRYRLIAEGPENAFFTRIPREFFPVKRRKR